MNIVVLCGGISTEREVSLWTGENVCNALRSKGHNAILMDVFLGREDITTDNAFINIKSISEELEIIKMAGKNKVEVKKNRKDFFGDNVIEICKAADITFMALHGENGENGKVQAAFDLFGIKYTGSDCLSSAMAMNKSVTRMIFNSNDIPMAGAAIATIDHGYNSCEELGLSYPVVIKPNCGGSSIGVFYADNDEEFKTNILEAFKFENELIIEDRIIGKEFSCAVIEYKALPVIEIIPKTGTYDFKNKYSAGAADEICPANISEELTKKIQKIAEAAAEALGINTYCRVDILTDEKDNCYCLEVNTLPGMTRTSLLPQEAAAEGIDFPSLCEKLIEISLNARY